VPEPVETKTRLQDSPLAESLSQAFLLMLERLSPNERAAFLLRSVFDYEYSEIAEVLGKSELYARQIFSRAKSRLAQDEPRFRAETHQADELAQQFVSACRAGDVHLVEQLLAGDIEVYPDGGGKVSAARVVIGGRGRAARFLVAVFHKFVRDCEMHAATVNGQAGVVFTSNDKVVQVVSLWISAGVRGVYITVNPDKLSRWSVAKID
jgi:RNA polymerase sigma-70 factor (ECF subfamily)